MKAMYFSSKNASPFFRKAVRVSTSTLSSVSPSLFIKFCEKVFLNPRGLRSYDFKTITPKEIYISGFHGDIKTYFLKGGDRHVLLTHGWADSSRSLETIMSELHKKGFSVWCFDHAGHGKSDGNISNLFAFIDGLKRVIDYIQKQEIEIYSLISHSMGGAAVLNLEKEFLKTKKIVFLAAPVMFFEEMFKTFDRIGVSAEVLTRLLNHVSTQYGQSWEQLKPMDQKYKIHKDFFVVHDKEDKQCKYENMLKLINKTDAQLKTSIGLGHRRILKDEDTLKAVIEFLK